MGQSLNWQAMLLFDMGLVDEARKLFQKAYDIYVKTLGAKHSRTKKIRERLERINDDLHLEQAIE